MPSVSSTRRGPPNRVLVIAQDQSAIVEHHDVPAALHVAYGPRVRPAAGTAAVDSDFRRRLWFWGHVLLCVFRGIRRVRRLMHMRHSSQATPTIPLTVLSKMFADGHRCAAAFVCSFRYFFVGTIVKTAMPNAADRWYNNIPNKQFWRSVSIEPHR